MATGTDAGGTWNTTAGNKTVVATPSVGDLIVVVHGMSGWASGDNSVITDNNSGGGGTYSRLGNATTPLSTGGGTACALWFSVRDELIKSASSTTFTATITGDTGGGLTVLRFSGMARKGFAAIRQFVGESDQTETPASLTFPQNTVTTNPVIMAIMGEDNPANAGLPVGFTEADNTGWATPATGIHVSWDDTGRDATTVYGWLLGTLADHNEIAIELNAGAAYDVWTIRNTPLRM
jgi:hypothetical protein